MNVRKTLLLGIVLAVAVAYLVMVAEPRRQSELSRDKILGAASPKTIQSLTFQPKGEKPYTLVHGDVGGDGSALWNLADLPTAKLDADTVNSILEVMRGLVFEGPIEDSELERDFSIYGLDAPALTMLVRDPDGSEREFAFGKNSDYLSKRYAKVSGRSGLFMVDSSAFGRLLKQRTEVRSRAPIAFNTTDVRELALESVQGSIKVTQPVVGEWHILAPAAHEASPAAVEAVLSAIRTLSAEDFIDGGESRLAEYALDIPKVRATITLREGLEPRVIRVSIGAIKKAENTSWFFTYDGAPSVFKFTPDKAPFLEMKVADLRQRKLLKWGAKEIETLTSAGSAETPVEIKANRTDWEVNGKTSDPVFVEQLLNDIVSLESVDFPEMVPPGAFDNPFLTLTIKKKGDNAETATLYLGKEVLSGSEPYRYVKVNEGGEVSLVRDVEAKRIVPHEEALIEKSTPTPTPVPTGTPISK